MFMRFWCHEALNQVLVGGDVPRGVLESRSFRAAIELFSEDGRNKQPEGCLASPKRGGIRQWQVRHPQRLPRFCFPTALALTQSGYPYP